MHYYQLPHAVLFPSRLHFSYSISQFLHFYRYPDPNQDLLMEQDHETDNCVIKLYKKKEKLAPLFIIDFSHGQIKINASGELNFRCFKKAFGDYKADSEEIRKLFATNGRLNYVGNSNIPYLRYFVRVHDKISGKMKLYDCVIFRMKPVLHIIRRNVTPLTLNYTEKINVLTENFGSKAKKRALSQKQKYSINETLERQVKIINSALELSPNKLKSSNSFDSFNYLPPMNRIASSVNDVFDIRHIISSEENNSLNKEAQEILIAPLDEFTKKRFSFCKYVSMRFENVTAAKAKYLLYLNYLMIFQHLKYADMRKKDPAPIIPDPYKKMIEKFTVIFATSSGRTVRSCSSQLKDKIAANILVLGLFIDEFKVNLEEIVEDMSNMKIPKLATIAEALGCYIIKKKIGEQYAKYAELKVPLNVPIPKNARSKLKKKL